MPILNKVVPTAAQAKKGKKAFVAVAISPEEIQKEFQTAHKNTGKELAALVVVVACIIVGFFALEKFI
ncbi:Protein CBG27400 [Caenorhabditis briggsae]|uniref:Uncharacterized protein n=2 Tax=Caenorhabditis briggsae TaxID=6238 RepID=A0AAE8ZM33_CAEBR|nr:Protein CBG27400 [Caenorhabditis briggsae]ULT79673.1 hypothetical protein L3Y34_010330 [Caenorhabditis briggsae]UMM38982.1 hypothetical protein L5515_016221 [Caenorhabditis briggsae]CAS00207.1 Protein CBG27400 [Caenorhabditis briggsae]